MHPTSPSLQHHVSPLINTPSAHLKLTLPTPISRSLHAAVHSQHSTSHYITSCTLSLTLPIFPYPTSYTQRTLSNTPSILFCTPKFLPHSHSSISNTSRTLPHTSHYPLTLPFTLPHSSCHPILQFIHTISHFSTPKPTLANP